MWAFWIGMAVLTAAVAMMLVRPLLRPASSASASRRDCDLAVYRAQLAEVEQDLARGVVDAPGAEALRAEVARRLLAVPEVENGPVATVSSSVSDRRLALGLMVVLPLAALALYLGLGQPNLPARPYADRQGEVAMAERMEKMEAAVAGLAERLKGQPDDLPGWRFLAQSLQTLGRHGEAVTAWRRVVALAPDTVEDQGALAEALILSEQGTVGPEAQRLLEALLAKAPGNPRAAHYLAEARAQAGDLPGALARWQALVRESPADAPWLPLVRDSLAEVARRLGKDPAAETPAPRTPSPAEIAAAEEAQKVALRDGMEKLKARLAAAPRDVEGWVYLSRAHAALDDLPQAREALAQALALVPDHLQALWLMGGIEQELGHPAEARRHWELLLGRLVPDSADYKEVAARLTALPSPDKRSPDKR